MTTNKLIRVAVSGPLKQTFTYAAGEHLPELVPGQRLIVPFGPSRKLGFYLGAQVAPVDFEVKEIAGILDEVSYFDRRLFDFCLWMADYYFANPADCLAAALPAPLRSRRAVRYRWHAAASADGLSSEVGEILKPGRQITKRQLADLRRRSGLVRELIEAEVIEEVWTASDSLGAQQQTRFRAGGAAVWETHFARRRFQPERFDGEVDRSALTSAGWSEYQIRAARQTGALVEVVSEVADSILPFVAPKEAVAEHEMTDEQSEVVAELRPSLGGGFASSLIHGVTGSGKTLVYCHLCREILKQGQTALVLTPEIALTGTTLAYFRGFFGDEVVTVIHSAMTERERLQSWRGIRSGKYRLVIGPRSAVFAPLVDLGAIIVDEEHDPSYKQDDPAPRFNGRDSAIMRAKMADVPVVLGSASPSIESYHHAQKGDYRLLQLKKRPAGATLPEVSVVDMRSQRLRGDLPFFSLALKKGLEHCLDEQQQAILFLNRRGHSPLLKCTDCGWVPQCDACGINLTFHRVGRRMICHYCSRVERAPDTCPKCGGSHIEFLGTGTQKVEEALPQLFPDARLARLDSDTARGRTRAHRLLSQFSEGKHDILLGTQMVAKGLDFPRVTLVGILAADLSLDLPDFRASERTFARLLQVAGRSGRAEEKGKVLVQTYYPESSLIELAAAQDYSGFYQSEIESRRALRFPPFSHLISLTLSARAEDTLNEASAKLAERLHQFVSRPGSDLEILGPAPCPLYRLGGRFRRRILLKTERVVTTVRGLTAWEAKQPRLGMPSAVRLTVDVDPDDLM